MILNLSEVNTTIEPTEKMLSALETIKKWTSFEIPEKCYKDFFECSIILDQYLDLAKTIATDYYRNLKNMNESACISKLRLRQMTESSSIYKSEEKRCDGSLVDMGWTPYDVYTFEMFS